MQWSCPKEIKYQTILGLLLVAVFTGCRAGGWGVAPTSTPTLEPSLIDSSILTGIPCAAPCWYRLEIGRSTKADISATARSLSFIDPKEFPEERSSYWDSTRRAQVAVTLIRLKCRQPEWKTCAALLVVNDVLRQIDLSPPPALTLGEAVAHLGPPDYVRRMTLQSNVRLCDVALIWKERGIWIVFRNGSSQVRCQDVHSSKDVSPNLPVGQIIYGSADDYIFATASESGGDLPWSGFAQP
jgi:hypothetical protein